MVEEFSQYSRNPTDDDSMVGMFSVVLRKFLQNVDDMLPGRIVAYDPVSNLAQVQPMISMLTTNNEILSRAPLQSLPVQRYGGGGFVLQFPIKPGDLGFIKANDRDISLFKQSLTESTPNTKRQHNFGDAVFLPMVLAALTISSTDANNVVLQSLNGSVRLSLGSNHACITDQIAYAQSSSAILDVQSITKAFKFPAMTTTQKNAISSPRAGFAVFDTTSGGVSVYNGTVWS